MDQEEVIQMDHIKTPYYDFFKLEKEMKLFSFQHKGVYYWQLIRFGLLKKITISDAQVSGRKADRSIAKEILGAYRDSNRTRKAYKKAKKVDVIRIRPIVTLSKDGKLDDHQYDYMELDRSLRVMDLYALGDYTNVPDCAECTLSQAEARLIIWKIKRKILGEKKLDTKQKESLEGFLKKIDEIYGTRSEIDIIEGDIQYMVASHRFYKERYKKIFAEISPKVIMVYPHYDEHMFSAMAAAKEMGIKSIEIQHGRINAHEAYWYEDQGEEGKILPDHFFAYGKWWIEQIKLPAFCKPVGVGNAYLESQLRLYPRMDVDKMTVSVFSSLQNGKELSGFVAQLDALTYKKDIQILYKLHPNERRSWKTDYPCLVDLKKTKVLDDETSVYDIFSRSKVVLGINSTTFFEATAYKEIRILIYLKGDHSPMKPLLDNGLAVGISNAEEFVQFLDSLDDQTARERTVDFDLWEVQAKRNISDMIFKILNSG